ncbi:hypothetical protein ONZ45_g2049 [Pleurotus djamor]|nr:hypothetical protein ONZ45_g2049 [Pleurotus djamor]
MADEENITITASTSKKFGKRKSGESGISDIQTRIFEIQELRHKSQIPGDNANTTNIIDQSLMILDERLEAVSKGIKSINETLEPLLQSTATPTIAQSGDAKNDNAVLLRKHAALLQEWEAVQDESEVLREELKEDKWLTVFRTVTDQADGMMSSLEKAVTRYKGVRDRVTKNGETLRRHAESAQRWKNLRERITRTDAEMENVRSIILHGDPAPSEGGSSTSGHTSYSRGAYLATPPSGSKGSRAASSASTISNSMSPLRKFARKITGSSRQSPNTPVTPLPASKPVHRTPASEPVKVIRRQRTSVFGLRGDSTAPSTPDRPTHKHSHSLTPDPSPRVAKIVDASSTYGTVKGRSSTPSKQRWNSSTKIEAEDKSKTLTQKRPPSVTGNYDRESYEDVPPVPPLGSSYRRSLSRTSMTSSRPWSPVTSSSSHPPMPTFRPPSRAQTPSQSGTAPGLAASTPKPRPRTPSHIPGPAKWRSFSSAQSEGGWDEGDSTTMSQRALSPTFSATSASSPGRAYPRPPSRSMIPVPSLQLSSPSRPGSSMSKYADDLNASSTFRGSAMRAQTPEAAVRARAQQVPIYPISASRSGGTRPPPSSFREGSGSTSRAPSRSGSRAGSYTPNPDQGPIHEYILGNPKDPLDVELTSIVNSIPHGLLVERVDPPLKNVPKEGEEVRAQYSFSNALSRKVITCKLTTLTRSGRAGDTISKKVMCRVGGGWQDLQLYILNRQAGL